VPPRPASADQHMTDPKVWCESVVKLVADKEFDKAVTEIADSTGGLVGREEMAQQLAPIGPALQMIGQFYSSDLIAERHYGPHVARYWNVLVFDKGDIYTRCHVMQRGDVWILRSFSFNTDPDALATPATAP
jgi:hypothetical protein